MKIINNDIISCLEALKVSKEMKPLEKKVILLKDDLYKWFLDTLRITAITQPKENKNVFSHISGIPLKRSKDIGIDLIGIFQDYDEVIIIDSKTEIKVINKADIENKFKYKPFE